jgi:hypothetical protein
MIFVAVFNPGPVNDDVNRGSGSARPASGSGSKIFLFYLGAQDSALRRPPGKALLLLPAHSLHIDQRSKPDNNENKAEESNQQVRIRHCQIKKTPTKMIAKTHHAFSQAVQKMRDNGF